MTSWTYWPVFDPSIEDDPSWWASRLTLVRGFATYLHTIDPATQVPSADLLRAHPRHATPYLYTDEDVAALLAAAAGLRTTHRVATYRTPDRSAGRDRNAGRRSHRARSARLRRRAGADHRSSGQAREIPRPSVASHCHHRGPAVSRPRGPTGAPATPPRCSCPSSTAASTRCTSSSARARGSLACFHSRMVGTAPAMPAGTTPWAARKRRNARVAVAGLRQDD